MALIFPKISNDGGLIKKEYRKSFNRELNFNDLKDMSNLCQKKEFQKLIDNYNIRKIALASFHSKELTDLFNDLAESQNLLIFKFFYKKICCYDEKDWILENLNKKTYEKNLQKYIDIQVVKLIDSGDYADTLKSKYPELLQYCSEDE